MGDHPLNILMLLNKWGTIHWTFLHNLVPIGPKVSKREDDHCGHDCMVVEITTTCAMLITTNVVSLNPFHGEVYSIQHYVIKFFRWLVAGLWFIPFTPVSSTNKTDCLDITKILLKVAFNTTNQPIKEDD